MPPKRRYSAKRAPKRSYKGRRTFKRASFKRTSYGRKRSYKTFRRSKKGLKGGPKHFAKPKSVAKRYVSVGRDITRDYGFYKLSTVFETPVRGSETTPDLLQQVGVYWIGMASMSNPFAECAAGISGNYKTPRGFNADISNKFMSHMVYCQRITAYVQRHDNGATNTDPWEVMLTPMRPVDLAEAKTVPVDGVLFPSTDVTPQGRYSTQLAFPRTVKRVMNNKGSMNTGIASVSQTVHMNDMVLHPNFKNHTSLYASTIRTTYEELTSGALTVEKAYRPFWCLSINRKCAGATSGTGPARWSIRFRYTWWIKAWDPHLNYLIQNPAPKPVGAEDDEPDLDAFTDLSVDPEPEPVEEKKTTPMVAAPVPPAVLLPPKPAVLKRSLTNVGSTFKTTF